MTGVQALRLCVPFNLVTFHLEKHFLSSDCSPMYNSFVEYVWTYVMSAPWSCIFSCTFYSTIETADPLTKKIFEWVCGAPRCIETKTTRITSWLRYSGCFLCTYYDCVIAFVHKLNIASSLLRTDRSHSCSWIVQKLQFLKVPSASGKYSLWICFVSLTLELALKFDVFENNLSLFVLFYLLLFALLSLSWAEHLL